MIVRLGICELRQPFWFELPRDLRETIWQTFLQLATVNDEWKGSLPMSTFDEERFFLWGSDAFSYIRTRAAGCQNEKTVSSCVPTVPLDLPLIFFSALWGQSRHESTNDVVAVGMQVAGACAMIAQKHVVSNDSSHHYCPILDQMPTPGIFL